MSIYVQLFEGRHYVYVKLWKAVVYKQIINPCGSFTNGFKIQGEELPVT